MARTILLQKHVAALDKLAGGIDRLLQVAAGVVAQIEDDAGHAQLFGLGQVGFQLVGDAVIEAQNLDVRDMRFGDIALLQPGNTPLA